MDRIQDYEINAPRWLSLEDFDGEVWKPILGYESLYEISNYGRIKCLPKNGRETFVKKILMAKHRCNYWIAELSKNNKKKRFFLHRLVAIAFIPNPDNLPQVNHKDEDKTNPIASNLEWCNQKYNSRYGTMPERMKVHMIRRRREERNISSKKLGRQKIVVHQYSFEGKYINTFNSQKEACKALNLSTGEINDALKGRIGSAAGFIWTYTRDEKEIQNKLKKTKGKTRKRATIPVAQYTLEGNYICTYPSASLAAKANNLFYSSILKCAKGKLDYYKGYKWKFVK